MKVTDLLPAGIFIVAGTLATVGRKEDRATTSPLAGAGPLRVKVPTTDVDELPLTVAGATTTEIRTAGVTLIVACFELARYVAVTVAVEDAITAFVLILNVPDDFPAPIEAVAGTDTPIRDEARFTEIVPVPKFAFKVTVPEAVLPPGTDEGEIVTPVTAKGLSVKVDEVVIPPHFAVMVTVVAVFAR